MPCSGLRTPARLSIRQWGLLSDGMLKADRRQARAEPDKLEGRPSRNRGSSRPAGLAVASPLGARRWRRSSRSSAALSSSPTESRG